MNDTELVDALRRAGAWLKEWDSDEGKLHVAASDAIDRVTADLAAARAERDGLAKALREIRDQDWTENALDPQWAGRIARAALAALPPKEDDR